MVVKTKELTGRVLSTELGTSGHTWAEGPAPGGSSEEVKRGQLDEASFLGKALGNSSPPLVITLGMSPGIEFWCESTSLLKFDLLLKIRFCSPFSRLQIMGDHASLYFKR